MQPLVAAELHELLVERDGDLGAGGGEKLRPASLLTVAVERELRDDQHLAADVRQATVHFAGFILENTQARELFGQLHGLGLGVLMGCLLYTS